MTERSGVGVVSVSVALLLAVLVSVTPAGTNTVAVLLIEPLAFESIEPMKVKVTLAATGRSTVAARAPLPLDGPTTLAPPLVADDHNAPMIPTGSRSVTVAPFTALGPLLLTTIV